MKTVNCTDWEEVTHEGINENEPARKMEQHICRGIIKLIALWAGVFIWAAVIIKIMEVIY